EPAGTQDKGGPGQGTAEEIGAEQGESGPALLVRDLDVLAHLNPAARRLQAVAQLNVLDALRAVPLVEAAAGQENVAANGAASAPERVAFLMRVLVDVMLEQVLVLGQEVRGGRGIIVGANDRGVLRPVAERLAHLADDRGRHDHIGINEQKEFVPGSARPQVARRGGPAPSRHPEYAIAELASLLDEVLTAAV